MIKLILFCIYPNFLINVLYLLFILIIKKVVWHPRHNQPQLIIQHTTYNIHHTTSSNNHDSIKHMFIRASGAQTHIITSNTTTVEKADATASWNEFEINVLRKVLSKSDATRVAVAIHWIECLHWPCWKGLRHGIETSFIIQIAAI